MNVSIKSLIMAVGISCLPSVCAIAEGPVTPTPSAPSCTLADVSAVMASDPNCSLQNVVVFGSNVIDFVTTQCAPFAPEPGNSERKARKACLHCARDAWAAFRAAAGAKLIAAKPKKENLGQIKKLCGYNGGDKDNGDEDSDSDALKNLYGQLRLCFPEEGQSLNADACMTCAMNALDAALSGGTITQSKFNVMKASIRAACIPAEDPHPDPTPTPVSGENSFKKYGQGLRACFEEYITDQGRDTAGCLSCVQAVDASGLNPEHVSQYLGYATATCNGTSVRPTPTPTPTPTTGGNSFQKYGQGLNACFQQFITDQGRDAAGCISCINGVDATGLDPTPVASYLSYATARCNGTNL